MNIKCIKASFIQLAVQIWDDVMLAAACLAPLLAGCLFRFGIPALENLLTDEFGMTEIIAPYYLIFDIFLAVMGAVIFSFASAMVILGEVDDGISRYLVVTPLGSSGYVISKIGLPGISSLIVGVPVTYFFSLTGLSIQKTLSLCLLSSILGIITSLLIVSISTNKVEGMAMGKLSGIILLGIPGAFFIEGPAQYLLSALPSFWIAKFTADGLPLELLAALATSAIWIMLLFRRFRNKVLR